jgi:hypothetical protein
MSSDSGTVVALKSSFLRSQIRILSQPLQPTDRWREISDIPASVVLDVMNEGALNFSIHVLYLFDEFSMSYELHLRISQIHIAYCFDVVNRILRRHNDTVYYSLAIRVIAQQIDQLYWDSAVPESTEHNHKLDDDSELFQTDDLTHDEYVTSHHRLVLVSIAIENAYS